MLRRFQHLLIGIASLSACNLAYAQTSDFADQLDRDAVRIAEIIGNGQLFLSNPSQAPRPQIDVDPATALRLQRYAALHGISVQTEGGVPRDLEIYRDMAGAHGTGRDRAAADFLYAYLAIKPVRGAIADPERAQDLLDSWVAHEDWFVSHMAILGKVKVHADQFNVSYALQMADASYDALPQTLDPYVLEAKSNTLSVIAMLQSLAGNKDGAIRTIGELIETKRGLGMPVDGETLLNNLAYIATIWGEQELGLAILHHAPPSGETSFYGLKEVREIRLLAETGQFAKAIDRIDETELNVTYPPFQQAYRGYRAMALAGLGRVEAARDILDTLDTSSGTLARLATQSELLFAAYEGRPRDVLTSSNAITRIRMQEILRAANADTSKFLATLDNEAARRDERQAALEREAQNRALRERMIMVIALLLGLLAAMLAIFATYATRFARWRTQNADLVERLTLRAESADESKRNFLGMMSHELRTPLNGVIGLADHLGSVLNDPGKAHLSEMISESGYDLLDVVENILDMAQIDTGQMVVYEEALDLRALVDSLGALWRPMIESREHGRNVRFTCFVDDSVPDVVELDPSRMRQILNQLLSNAGKFTHTGRVHLHVTGRPATEAEGPDGEMGPPSRPTCDLDFIVADTGMGITPEARTCLFEPFVQADTSMTRKFGGSGLGLAIARALSRIMHGDIEVISNPGRGSEFRLSVKAPVLARPRAGLASHIPSPLVAEEEALMVSRNSKPSQFWNPDAPQPSYAMRPSLPGFSRPRPTTLRGKLRRFVRTFRTVMSPSRSAQGYLRPEIVARAERQADATRLKRRRVSGSSVVVERPRTPAPDMAALDTAAPDTAAPDAASHTPGRGAASPDGRASADAAFVDAAFVDATARFHAAPPSPSVPAVPAIPASGARALRVIAAEDVVMNQRVLEALIDGPDAKVTCVGTAEELVDAHALSPFDIIIMDIHMPGMGGVEGIRAVRSTDTRVPIIALTADVGAQTHARAQAAGADLFLTKPVIGADLREAFAYCATLNRKAA